MNLIKKFYITVLFITAFNGFTSSQWNKFNNLGTTEVFLDSRQITASTSIACGWGGRIVRTTNAGTGWTIINSTVTVALSAVFFLPADTNTGWISGDNVFLKTTNKGLSWIAVNTSQPQCESMFFIDNNTGWLVGIGNVVHKTTNSGASFTSTNIGSSNHRVMDVHFFSSSKGYALLIDVVNNRTFIMSTANGGSAWITLSVINDFMGMDFQAFDTKNIYIAGTSGRFAKTNDGGFSWALITVVSMPSSFESISFADANTGYIAGSSVIYKTIDAGTTWIRQVVLEAPFFFSAVSTLPDNANIGFGTGNFGTAYGTTDGGDNFTESSNIKNAPKSFSLGQNSPNPFNPVTTFSFTIPNASNVELKIYDSLGKEMAVVVSEHFTAGSYEVSFDASHLSSGTYFYRLQTESFTETKKMILVK